MDNEGTKLTMLSLIVLHMSYFISCTYAQGILTTLYTCISSNWATANGQDRHVYTNPIYLRML